MTIAILAWGSLVWDKRDLPIQGEWQPGGPVLPIEFARISQRGERAGCLTLVIDERNGVDVPTRFALSPKTDLEHAISDLQEREGTPQRDRIGFVDMVSGRVSSHSTEKHPRATERIRSWCASRRCDAAIWTALGLQFKDAGQLEPFSPEAALRYVMALPGPVKAKAFEYIRRAPEEVVTPFRMAFSRATGAETKR